MYQEKKMWRERLKKEKKPKKDSQNKFRVDKVMVEKEMQAKCQRNKRKAKVILFILFEREEGSLQQALGRWMGKQVLQILC